MSGIVIIIFFHLKVVNFILELRNKSCAVRVGFAVVFDRHNPVAIRPKVPIFNWGG